MAKDYHGEKPITNTDMQMAKTHLTGTIKLKKAELALNKNKIADHKQAIANTNDPKSVVYNQGHINGHVKDNKVVQKTIDQRQTSMKTLGKLQPVSKGLISYIAKKKLGASNIAAMAGKKG